MKTNGIVVVNLHGVLIDDQWEIYKRIQRNWSKYCGYMQFPKFISHKEFIKRDAYDMCHNLMLANYKTKAAYVYGSYKTQAAILKDMYEANDFYPSCDLLNFAKLCILKPAFIESGKIRKVIILIEKYSDKQERNARAFCEAVFNHPKISILSVEPEQKSKLLTTSLKTFTLYLDHSIPTIKKVAEKMKDLETVEFLIPRYNFNTMPIELSMLIHGKQGAFTYYGEEDDPIGKNIL